jgi:hypothetical protein
MENVSTTSEQRKGTEIPADVPGGHSRATTQREGVPMQSQLRSMCEFAEDAPDVARGSRVCLGKRTGVEGDLDHGFSVSEHALVPA